MLELLNQLDGFEATKNIKVKYLKSHLIYLIAWEPSAAQVSKSYSRHLPALNPIPAGGGVNLTPPCSFFYITQKVLV